MKSINGILVTETSMPDKAFSIVSGGLDSSLATYIAKHRYKEVIPVFFDWGQKALHEEWKAVKLLASKLELTDPVSISIPISNWDNSSLTKGNPSQIDPKNIIVFERNLIFISIAASFARSHGGGTLVVGFNKQDAGYDTKDSFVAEINTLLNQLNKEFPNLPIGLDAPLIQQDKYSIISQLKEVGLFDLTYSCYAAEGPCNKCPACEKRAKFNSD